MTDKKTPSNCRLDKCEYNYIAPPENSQECLFCEHQVEIKFNGVNVELVKIVPGESPDYGKQKSGRCHNCEARFIWPSKLGALKDSRCPFCGGNLQLTTHLWTGSTYRIVEGTPISSSV